MNVVVSSTPSKGSLLFCPRLRGGLSHLASIAIVQIGDPSGDIFLSTRLEDAILTPQISASETLAKLPGQMLSCVELDGDARLHRQFTPQSLRSAKPSTVAERTWRQFSCKFMGGAEDQLAMRLTSATDSKAVLAFLKTSWPTLRQGCLRDSCTTAGEVCDKAMHWMVASRMNVAMLVMNGRGAMLRANPAAMQLLQTGTVLRRSPTGICCNTPRQTTAFLGLLAKCAADDPSGPEKVMFIDAEAPAIRVPVTMARYWHNNAATDLVTVMIPMPPDSRRVEMLARAIGLTPAEARIASLMQMGLSNKDAAKAAGLKEQSVSTYAKRVLSKMNVTSRAEMAQMLTWQSAGGSL